MAHITTAIDIDATPETVWGILADLEGYDTWNPFAVSASGEVTAGSKLRVVLQPPGGKAMSFAPTVTEAEPAKVFEWLGRLGVPGVFDGRHRFELIAVDGGTRLLHTERFRGILVPLLFRSLEGRTREGFEAMNQALKQRAEAAGPAGD